MRRSKSIEALLRKSRDGVGDLKRAYEASLHAKAISEELKVDIKNIFENLRSCLDYLAQEIFESCCPQSKPPDRLYFPIRKSRQEFDQAVSKYFPNLQRKRTHVYDFLESLQPYNDPWIGEFNQLNNENKHQDLVEQIRTESRRVTVSRPDSGSVSWGPGVTFGRGVSVMGVPIDPKTQLPVPNTSVKTEIVTWVDFRFRENSKSVLAFVEGSINSVEKIYLELSKYI
jgi:hypothetical protein